MNPIPPVVAPAFPSNCDNKLASLAKSPTFAMSLGAKELFHTNFLAFLLESQDPLVDAVQRKLKQLLFGRKNVGRVITWREKKKLDLVIMLAPKNKANSSDEYIDAEIDYDCTSEKCKHPDKKCKCPIDYCDTIAVVIEAKLKSIPTQLQLDGYDEKLMNGIDFELDDNDTVPVCIEEDASTWQFMRLTLNKNRGMEDCTSECTIQARGKSKDVSTGKAQGRTGKIKELKGTVRRILLHPMSDNFNDCDAPPLGKKMGCWEQMSWQCVVEALKCDQQEDPCVTDAAQLLKCKETELLPRIICDYRDSLEQLLSILNQTELFVNLSVDKPSKLTFGEYYKAITDKRFTAKRIHDLVGKYASHILEQHIKESLDKTPVNTSGNTTDCENAHSADDGSLQIPCFKMCDLEFKLNSYTHFSNQQPGVGFEWHTTLPVSKKVGTVSFGVQIQGTAYRHYISVAGGATPQQHKDVLDKLACILGKSAAGWFLNGQFSKQSQQNPQLSFTGKMHDKSGSIIDWHVFNQGGWDAFRYSTANISMLPLPDLAQVVCRSLLEAKNIATSNKDCDDIKEFLNRKSPQALSNLS